MSFERPRSGQAGYQTSSGVPGRNRAANGQIPDRQSVAATAAHYGFVMRLQIRAAHDDRSCNPAVSLIGTIFACHERPSRRRRDLTRRSKLRMIWVYRCLDLPDQCSTGVRAGNPLHRFSLRWERALLGMSTFMASADTAAAGSRWHIIDADGQVLGRIATAAARLLQGKHKAAYTPFIDTGDHVVIVNA